MVTHKDSVLPQIYFTISFLSPCHDLQLAVGAASASGSCATDSWPGKKHHCQRVGQPVLPDTSGDASLSSSSLLHVQFSLPSL